MDVGDEPLLVALKYLDDVIFFPSGVTEDGERCFIVGVIGNTAVVGSVVVVVVKYLDLFLLDMTVGNADDCSEDWLLSNRWISIAFVPETGKPCSFNCNFNSATVISCHDDDDEDEEDEEEAINNDAPFLEVGGVIVLINSDARREKVLVTTRPSADDTLPPMTAVRHTAVAVFIQ